MTDKEKLEAIDKALRERTNALSACFRIREILDGKLMKLGLCSAPIMEKQACCKSSCDNCNHYN